jgi:hypothetical protein
MSKDIFDDKHELDEFLFNLFAHKDTDLCFKIERNQVHLHQVKGPRVLGAFPDGYEIVDKETYKKILPYIEDGFIFTNPVSQNLKSNMFDKSQHSDRIESELFMDLLSKYTIKDLKEFDCFLVPKKINLHEYQGIVEDWAKKYSGSEITDVLNSIPLSSYNNDYLSRAFIKSFSYIDGTIEKLKNVMPQLDPETYLLTRKQDVLQNFIEKNQKFIQKDANRVWFTNFIAKLEPKINIRSMLNEDQDVDLFAVDDWKHATVEVSKHGLYKNYPMPTTVSSYSAQSGYKSILSQFATFIASNDAKLKWGINVEQAHLGIKKNGNFLFSLSHSQEEPNKEKFQKIFHLFLDYIKSNLSDEKTNMAKFSNDIFNDKAQLKKMMDNLVLFNDLSTDLPENTASKRKMKI